MTRIRYMPSSDGNIRQATPKEITVFEKNFIHSTKNPGEESRGARHYSPKIQPVNFDDFDRSIENSKERPTKQRLFLEGILEQLETVNFVELMSDDPYRNLRRLYKVAYRYGFPLKFATSDNSIFISKIK